jgi:crotonobetainyl-CoA:carnitine CoA-transferase CaiB-like acyl-CoA transferase
MRPYRQSGPSWRFLDSPAHEMRRSPWFGEHNDALLAEAGCTAAEVEALRAQRVIADAPIDPGIG